MAWASLSAVPHNYIRNLSFQARIYKHRSSCKPCIHDSFNGISPVVDYYGNGYDCGIYYFVEKDYEKKSLLTNFNQ